MTLSELYRAFRWKIESKPEGGFIARSEDPPEIIEAATREEIEAKIKEKLAAALGPEFAAKLDLSSPGTHTTTHVEKKFSFSLSKPGQTASTATPAQLESGAPPPIDAGGGSMLSALWKIAVLVGIAIVIWLLLQRR